MKIRLFALPLLLALLGASCAPPPRTVAVDAPSLVTQPSAPRASPAPIVPAPEAANTDAPSPLKQIAATDKVDYSCKTSADCAVKDVGSCCGAHPQCVNKDAATDPNGVRAQCRKEHRMGVCSMEAIGGCSCVQGQCSNINAAQMPDAH